MNGPSEMAHAKRVSDAEQVLLRYAIFDKSKTLLTAQ